MATTYSIILSFKNLKTNDVITSDYGLKYDSLKSIIKLLEKKLKDWFSEEDLKTLIKKENTYFIKDNRNSFIYEIVKNNNHKIRKVNDFI